MEEEKKDTVLQIQNVIHNQTTETIVKNILEKIKKEIENG